MPRGKIRKKNGKYLIDYFAHGRRIRKVIGSNRVEAERVLNKRLGELVRGEHPDIFKNKIKFDAFADKYEMYSRSYKRSWARNGKIALQHLKKEFGGIWLSMLGAEMIEGYRRKRKEKLFHGKNGSEKVISDATINREISVLRALLNKAKEWGYLSVNPVDHIKFYSEKNNARMRYLPADEINTLLRHCGSRLRKIVLLALHTGMRKGEIQNLKWENIQFDRGLALLRNTKNGEPRHVVLNQIAKHAIASIPKHPASPYVFCDKDGKTYNFRKAFENAVRKSGIKDFRFHDLRHTYASHLVMAGVDLNTVRELLGHKSIAMTLRYSHLSPAHKANAVQVLAQKFGRGTLLSLSSKSGAAENFDDLINNEHIDAYKKFAGVAQR